MGKAKGKEADPTEGKATAAPVELMSGIVTVKKVEGGMLSLVLEGVPGVFRVPLENLPGGFDPERQTARGYFSINLAVVGKE